MSKAIRTEIKQVTPKMCTNWLNKNLNNRPLNQRHVNILTRSMMQDDWDVNGESLKFDLDGNILDGQHRMWACIESDQPFRSMIVHNLPRGTFDTIDTGRVRGGHDVLAMNGEVNTILLNGILKHVGRYYSGQMLSTSKITNKEVEALLDKHGTVRDLVAILSRTAYRVRWCAPSLLGTCWYLASKKSKTDAETFFHGLIFGVELKASSPMLTLRNKFIDIHAHKGQHLTSPAKMELIVIAWNAFRAGKPLQYFKLPALARESKQFPKFK